VLSADATRARRVAALRAGAWDFVAEPLDTEAFLLKLDTFARSRREVERIESATLIEEQTGLYNRAGLARRAEEVAADTRRRHVPLSCVVFRPDVAVSGSEAGISASRVATQVGAIFRRTGRASDVIARLDGVLAVIAPATDADGAQRLAVRLRNAIRETPATSGGTSRVLGVRAAYCAAADFARSTMSVEQMLERAVDLLRRAGDVAGPAVIPGDIVPLDEAR
jgi:PleD family two-component response regulator